MNKKRKTIIALLTIITITYVFIICSVYSTPIWISVGMPLDEAKEKIKQANGKAILKQVGFSTAMYDDCNWQRDYCDYKLKNGIQLELWAVRIDGGDGIYYVDMIKIDNKEVTELNLNEYK